MRQAAIAGLLLGLLTGTASAQPAAPSSGPVTVYVDFRDVGATDLASFAARFVQLGLADLGSLTLRVGPSPCRPVAVSQSNARVQRGDVPDAAAFYVVSGGIAKDPTSANVDFHYELAKACAAPLVEDSQLVRQESFASALGIATDRIRLQLKELAPTKPFVVAVVVAPKNEKDAAERAAADDVMSYLVAKLDATREFQPAQPAARTAAGTGDYLVRIDVSAGRSTIETTGSVASQRAPQSTVSMQALSRPKGEGPALRAIGEATLTALNDLRAASVTGRAPADISRTPTNVLIADAKRLLCLDDAKPDGCRPQPDAAVALLTKAPKNDDILLLLGQAQLRAGQSQTAGETLEAVSLRTQGDLKQQALGLAGDAWFAARNYDRAAQRYGSWLEGGASDPAAPAFELKRDRSLRLGHANEAAANALIRAVEQWPSRMEFQIELSQLIAEFHPDELRSALPKLDTKANVAALTNARTSIRARIAAEDARAGQYAEAERLLGEAIALTPFLSDSLRLQLAQAYYDHARSMQPPSRDLLARSIAEVSPLVDKRVPDADWLLQSANHLRGDDNATVAKMRNIIKDRPSDDSALTNLGFVCNEFLFDYKCTLEANEQRLKNAGPRPTPELQLDLLESQALNGKWDDATQRFNLLLQDRVALGQRLLPVALFYGYWAARTQRRPADQLFAQWKEAIAAWGRNVSFSFDGARRLLAGQSQLGELRTTLTDMIAKMDAPAPSAPTNLRIQ